MPEITGLTAPKPFRGALVPLVEDGSNAVPVVIPFQYNPENMSRSFPAAESGSADPTETGQTAPQAQPSDPSEQIQIKLQLSAVDSMEDGGPGEVLGVAAQLAALEELTFPISTPMDAALAVLGVMRRAEAPTTLFVWGPGRVQPVRIKNVEIEETLWLPNLQPVLATVSLSMEVFTSANFCPIDLLKRPAIAIASSAYQLHRTRRTILASLAAEDDPTIRAFIPG